jgi:putative lipoic acid-binding regulatory protein
MEKPLIDYPCQWSFKIIGMDEQSIRKAVADYMGNVEYSITRSNISSKGKYVSVDFKTTVINESERNQIFTYLQKQPSVKVVI